jgi:hypothetical protein
VHSLYSREIPDRISCPLRKSVNLDAGTTITSPREMRPLGTHSITLLQCSV